MFFACFFGGATKRRGTPAFFFSFLGRNQKRCHLNTKNGEEGHPAFFSFFGHIQKRCHETSKMKKRDTPRLFLLFLWRT